MSNTGTFATSFYGAPASSPTLTELMDAWIAETENESTLALANSGLNSPAALASECMAVGQDYINDLVIFSPPPPDANLNTVKPYAAKIQFEAGMVPPSQFIAATFSLNQPDTIAQCMAAAQASITPAPVPPPVNFIGPSYVVNGVTMYTLAAGVSASGFQNGIPYPNAADGNSYVAHVNNFVGMGAQVWFSLVAKAS